MTDTAASLPIDYLRGVLDSARAAVTLTEQNRTVEAGEHIDAISRLIAAHQAAAGSGTAADNHLRAELAERAQENRQLRREAGRAADMIGDGKPDQAVSLLRFMSYPERADAFNGSSKGA